LTLLKDGKPGLSQFQVLDFGFAQKIVLVCLCLEHLVQFEVLFGVPGVQRHADLRKSEKFPLEQRQLLRVFFQQSEYFEDLGHMF